MLELENQYRWLVPASFFFEDTSRSPVTIDYCGSNVTVSTRMIVSGYFLELRRLDSGQLVMVCILHELCMKLEARTNDVDLRLPTGQRYRSRFVLDEIGFSIREVINIRYNRLLLAELAFIRN